MDIYNSLTQRVETFSPLSTKQVKLYTCGPTVYSRPHLGNYRTYLWEDTLKRYLQHCGYRVLHTMNITDYDNTIMKAVKKTGVPREKMTRENERLFRQDLHAFGAKPADKYPHVSGYADKMASRVIALLKKGFAYKDRHGRIFFDISKFKSYGKLVGKRISNSKKIEWEEYKPNQAGDFLIWKPCVNEDCHDGFDSILGGAHPPWNIQCAAMSTDSLGSQIDIAMGGADNKFNHHENTRAIAGAISGKEYAKYWVHIRHLIINGKKMSKRKGNVVLLPDMVRRGFSPEITRFILLSVHYRQRQDFTWAYARKMKERYSALAEGIAKLKKTGGNGGSLSGARLAKADGKGGKLFDSKLARLETAFNGSMDSDLNVPRAVNTLEKFLAKIEYAELSSEQGKRAIALLRKFDTVLACLPL